LERYTELFDFAPIGYFVLDGTGTIRALNFAGADLIGSPRRKLVGRRFALFVTAHHRVGFADLLARVVNQRADVRSETYELALDTDTGDERRDVALTIAPLAGEQPSVLVATVDITRRKRAELERERLAAEARELEMTQRLHEIGMMFLHEPGDLGVIYEKIVDAAAAIAGADFGALQLVDAASDAPKIAAQRGFSRSWIEFWDHGGHVGACGTALARSERVVVEDVARSPIFAGKPALTIQREAGVRAVVSTPLLSRANQVIGILSTHFRSPHVPDDRALRWLDLLARQAADLVDRARADAREAKLRRRLEAIDRVALALTEQLTETVAARLSDDAFRAIAEHAREACAADVAAVAVADDAAVRWIVVAPSPRLAARMTRVFERATERLTEALRTTHTARWRDADAWFVATTIGIARLRGRFLCVANQPSTGLLDEDDEVTLRLLAERVTGIRQVAQAMCKTRDAVRSRENLLAVVSHDLRSPLSSIQLAATIMTRGRREPERRQGQRQVDLILKASGRIKRLIDDLVDAAAIDAGKFGLVVSLVEVRALLDDTIEALAPVAREKSVQLDSEAPDGLSPIHADRERVMQILVNLIGNAIKFTPRGGRVHVRVSRRAGMAEFAVSDIGPGIAEDELARIFDRYEQGKAHGHRGVGLGLYIARGIVEAHHGRIWVESQIGVGTTFHFTVPRAPGLEQHAPGP
jgi:PAS domain S-box-containing protein